MRFLILLTSFLLFGTLVFAQNEDSIYDDDPTQVLPIGTELAEYKPLTAKGKKVDKGSVTPPSWWVGMSDPILELMIYGQNIRDFEVMISEKKGVLLKQVHKVENPNYLFLEIEISPGAQAGKFDIILFHNYEEKVYSYQLNTRNKDKSEVQGLNPSDLIYLIMPDRFANGDPSNDSFDDMRQVGINRDKMFFRHGGDLQGIIDHLDYLEELGVTALWLNPVLENDQPYASYHGYAITDHYEVDKRFGSNELYRTFVKECHQRGIKVVMDIIFNHCGHEHWLMKDIPEEEWVHQWPTFTKSNYKSSVINDPYASKHDHKQLEEGWFDYSMPDLNQKNLRLTNYLIQNTIWWVEYSGHDAYRIDTWFYPDQEFLSTWTKRMKEEFPNLGLFGETWVQNHSVQASFAQNSKMDVAHKSYLPSITDFQLHYAIEESLNKPQGWAEGVSKLYYTLAQDFLYEDPFQNVIFLDNHDKTRFFSYIGEDINKFKSGISLLLTLRGTPSLYYGTELAFPGVADPDGKVRQDFLGGWNGDKTNKFKVEGRSEMENEAFEYVSKLANYRKNTPALYSGKFMHFLPENGIYVYFRYDADKTIMIVLNTNGEDKVIDTARFYERMGGYSKAFDIMMETKIDDIETLTVSKNSTLILELKN